jgi:hypothetical protein
MKKKILKHLGAAASGFITGAASVLIANPHPLPETLAVAGLIGALSSIGWLHVPADRNPIPANTPPGAPQQ